MERELEQEGSPEFDMVLNAFNEQVEIMEENSLVISEALGKIGKFYPVNDETVSEQVDQTGVLKNLWGLILQMKKSNHTLELCKRNLISLVG